MNSRPPPSPFPVKYCVTCDRVRACFNHTRAEFPPDAAEKWLVDHCPNEGDGCEVRYQAGVS